MQAYKTSGRPEGEPSKAAIWRTSHHQKSKSKTRSKSGHKKSSKSTRQGHTKASYGDRQAGFDQATSDMLKRLIAHYDQDKVSANSGSLIRDEPEAPSHRQHWPRKAQATGEFKRPTGIANSQRSSQRQALDQSQPSQVSRNWKTQNQGLSQHTFEAKPYMQERNTAVAAVVSAVHPS